MGYVFFVLESKKIAKLQKLQSCKNVFFLQLFASLCILTPIGNVMNPIHAYGLIMTKNDKKCLGVKLWPSVDFPRPINAILVNQVLGGVMADKWVHEPFYQIPLLGSLGSNYLGFFP